MHVPLIAEVIMCFAFTGIALTLTRTTLIPIISACILPVYLQTTSWVYPISVTTMALVIIFMQWCMEKFGLRPHNSYEPCHFDYKIELKKWSKLIIVFSLIEIIFSLFIESYFCLGIRYRHIAHKCIMGTEQGYFLSLKQVYYKCDDHK